MVRTIQLYAMSQGQANSTKTKGWISDLRSKMTIPCHAVLDAVSQGQTKQYIYPRHPELDSGSIQNDFLSISINRFRVRLGLFGVSAELN